MMKLAASAIVTLLSTSALAETHLTAVTAQTVTCNTDGGAAKCSSGVRYLGELIQIYWTDQLKEKPLACGDAKPGSVVIQFGYEYNDGTTYAGDEEKVAAKFPPCVKEFEKQAQAAYLEWWKWIHRLDTSVDVRTLHKVTLKLSK